MANPTANERLARLETESKFGKCVVAAFVAWMGYLTVTMYGIDTRLARLEGKVGDPLTATIKGLESPPSTEALAANLSVLTARINAASVGNAKPRKEEVQRIANSLETVARQHPDLKETWQAVATLASYSTSEAKGQLPDCDTSRLAQEIIPSEVPELAKLWLQSPRPTFGYVYRNCTLRLDHLPPGKVYRGTAFPNGPRPEPFTVGEQAVLINCDIVLTDSGVAENNIIQIFAVNSRFEYHVRETPAAPVQKLLLASLASLSTGSLEVSLKDRGA
jgi:hypothetical protein